MKPTKQPNNGGGDSNTTQQRRGGKSTATIPPATSTTTTASSQSTVAAAAMAAAANRNKSKPSSSTAFANKRSSSKGRLGRGWMIAICICCFLVIYLFGRGTLLSIVTHIDNWLGEDDSESSSSSSSSTSDSSVTGNNKNSEGVSSSTTNTTTTSFAKKTNKSKLPPWANKKGSAAIPDYDTYVKFAEEQGWQPSDPVEKLTDTIRKYPQVFDLVEIEREKLLSTGGSLSLSAATKEKLEIEESDKIDEYLEILHEEIKFLLKILIKETDNTKKKKGERKIDLTEALHNTLDMMNQCYYRIMKHRIQLNNPRIVTKTDVESWTRSWLNEPVKDIMSIKAANISSMIIDANRLVSRGGGEGEMDLLMKATQFRLYGLFNLFASQGARTFSQSVHFAIINGDDLAVALLLKLNGDLFQAITKHYHQLQFPASEAGEGSAPLSPAARKTFRSLLLALLSPLDLLTHIQDAHALGYGTIEKRLTACLVHLVQTTLSLQQQEQEREKEKEMEQEREASVVVEGEGEGEGKRERRMLFTDSLPLSPQALITAHRYLKSTVMNAHIPSEEAETVYERLLAEEREGVEGVVSEERERLSSEILHASLGAERDIASVLKLVPLFNDFLSERVRDGEREEDEAPECVVDRIDLSLPSSSLSPIDHFYHNYIRLNKPIILKLPTHLLTQEMFEREWSREAMLQGNKGGREKGRERDVEVILSNIPYGSLFGESEEHWSLSDYLSYVDLFDEKVGDMSPKEYYLSSMEREKESGSIQTEVTNKVKKAVKEHVKPLYLFGNNQQAITNNLKPAMVEFLANKLDETSNDSLWDFILSVSSKHPIHNTTTSVPSLSLLQEMPINKAKYQFFYGAKYSGAPMHSHGPAFNILLKGEKLWNLLPPARDMYTNIHPLEWIATSLEVNSTEYPHRSSKDGSIPTPRLCQLRQVAGEVLYVPRHFSHQVLNMDKENVGFAVEVDSYVY